MTVPSPAIMAKTVNELVSVAEKLLMDYRYLAKTAYERPKRGQSGGRSSGHNDVSSTLYGDAESRSGGTSRARRDIETAAKCVFQALGYLNRAQAALGHAGDSIDKGAVIEPDREERVLLHPADKGDLERARFAQVRRGKRARVSGDWDEVTG